MKIALVTTWGSACGIAEHSAYLKAAIEAADPDIEVEPIRNLHPSGILAPEAIGAPQGWDLVILNYHAALHSQWTPAAIVDVQIRLKIPVLVIYHDTGVPCSEQCLAIVTTADAAVVHEPCAEFAGRSTVHYWRMGVPGWSGVYQFDRTIGGWCGRQPILGTIGFPFPWKNYAVLAEITAAKGWALLLIAPGATPDQITEWQGINPHLHVRDEFVPASLAGAMLSACDATAFLYTCANGGQSAAILQGIAARKPVYALETCRQFRALYQDPLANKYLRWCTGFGQFADRLPNTPIGRLDAGMVALAEQDGWASLGVQYAELCWGVLRR